MDMKGSITGFVVAAALTTVAWWAPGLAGQAPATRPSASTPPRTAEGQPDLQGVWRVWNLAKYDVEPHAASPGVPAGAGVIVEPADGMIPYKRWALARKKENFANSRTSDPGTSADPLAKCYIPGVPRITYLGWPFQIIQTEEYVAFVYEWMHMRRLVPLNNSPRLDLDFWGGIPRGRWDGTALVVETTNLSDRTWFDMAGNFHSKAAKVVERYARVDPDVLNYEVDIEDPNVFTRPWKMRMPVQRQKDIGILEYECHALLEESGVPITWDRDWDRQTLEIPKE